MFVKETAPRWHLVADAQRHGISGKAATLKGPGKTGADIQESGYYSFSAGMRSKAPIEPGNTTGLSNPSLATDATPNR